jgi:hypothetical protein
MPARMYFSVPIGDTNSYYGLWKEGTPPTYTVVPNPPRQEE